MPWGANISIQITDGDFRKMMEDSKFKNKMMKVIREDAFYVKKVAKKREYMKLLEKRG
ncbi:hypothetical protein C823_000351 [Eubacterium plexicaudatum ASF492]|nr:hypothetical protein C823_000351 [Eubacterium plexicaudatum ASF492]